MLIDQLQGDEPVRSTSRLSARKMRPIIEAFESSSVLYRFDVERRPRGRELKFTAPQMMTMMFYVEVKKLDTEGYMRITTGRGSQAILRNLGMPTDGDGNYIAPSVGWLSEFRNHYYPLFMKEFEREFREAVLRRTSERRVITIDSTPIEASRYSDWADFNGHYMIFMGKLHIIMVNGVPIMGRFTNGNYGDNPAFREMLNELPNGRMRNTVVLSDGGYDCAETYTDVFLKTGVVMASNTGVGSVKHEEAEWNNMKRRHGRLFKNDDFPKHKVSPEQMLRYMARNGESELVGWFIRNLDMSRGKRISRELARQRHVCETVHHAMKRWVDLTVRGLREGFAEARIGLRLMVCSFLCILFKPYDI